MKKIIITAAALATTLTLSASAFAGRYVYVPDCTNIWVNGVLIRVCQ